MTEKAVSRTPPPKPRARPVKVVRGLRTGGGKLKAAPGGWGAHSYVDVFRAEPLARVRWIKQGLPANFLDQLSREMNMPKERLLPALGIAQATVSRKVRESKPLSSDDSERALGMARLVGQVEAMVEESGDPVGFNAAEWVAQWLEEPLAALGGQRPADLMDTSEGQAIVANVLARMQSGAYA